MVAERKPKTRRHTPEKAAHRRRLKRANTRQLTQDEARRLRNKVDRIVCSARWGDDVAAEADAQGIQANTREMQALLQRYEIYPPPADPGQNGPRTSPVVMLQCDLCGHVCPPQTVVDAGFYRLCLDCNLGASVGAVPDQLGLIKNGALRNRVVYQELRKTGLCDREIAVLSLWWSGHSEREIARFRRQSKTQVHRVLKSAASKVGASGLSLPDRPPAERQKIETVDPMILDLGPRTSRITPRQYAKLTEMQSA